MVNHRRRRGQAAKLQPKFVGPYVVVEAIPNYTYEIERSRQVSIQNEARLKQYWASLDAVREAPPPPVVGAPEADNDARAAAAWTRV